MDVSFDDLIQRLDDEIQLLIGDARYGVRLSVCRETHDAAVDRARRAGRFEIVNLLGNPPPNWACVSTEDGLPVFYELRYKLERARDGEWEGPLSPKQWRRKFGGISSRTWTRMKANGAFRIKPGSTERSVSIHRDDVQRLKSSV